MSFLEDLISEIASQGIYSLFKWIGVFTKWSFYFGRKSVFELKKEKWNTAIGLLIVVSTILVILYLINLN